jgi:hypothetical protein
VAAQDNRAFSWIIYFDVETPPTSRSRIEELRKLFPFHAYYTGLFPAEGWPRSIREVLAPTTPLFLSTTLDNDDALATDHVGRLQEHVAALGHAPGAYNFTNGLIRRGSSLYEIRHPSNAFFSWLEPNGPALRTAPSIRHMSIASEGPVHQIGGPPGWMQIVHGSNVSNKVRGRRVQPKAAEGRFTAEVCEDLVPARPSSVLAENLLLAPVRSFRDQLVNFLRG